ncbi:MAG: MBL fold metallo-hydrolase [Thermoprotei archaeon]|nr:MAG: MBL fold metallo-hydrolase [Thermoprotei archaeon]
MPSIFSKPIELGDIKVHLIYFDSLGAKSSCVLIETPDVNVLVDPGVAEMQPGYPLSWEEKVRLRDEAFKAILEASKRAEVITISHYHYDHHTLPSQAPQLYEGKELLIKDPNAWINGSQWSRARLFLDELHRQLGGSGLEELAAEPRRLSVGDPLSKLRLALSKDYGDYAERKKELLEKGEAWFKGLVEAWSSQPWVKEFELRGVKVRFADGRSFRYGSTTLTFTEPLFHGVEYDRLGWVLMLTVEYGGVKVVHSSDLQGPIIEDYAELIIAQRPDLIILDGPPTYLYGYTLNRINLNRAVENAKRIVAESGAKLIIYDHHLLRDRLYKRRLEPLYSFAPSDKLMTAAEWLGRPPLILKLAGET